MDPSVEGIELSSRKSLDDVELTSRLWFLGIDSSATLGIDSSEELSARGTRSGIEEWTEGSSLSCPISDVELSDNGRLDCPGRNEKEEASESTPAASLSSNGGSSTDSTPAGDRLLMDLAACC